MFETTKTQPSTPPLHGDNLPEFIDVKTACRYASLTKPTLYNLLNSGAVKSVSLRQRGKVRGKRLIVADSLVQFLRSRIA